MAGGIETFSTVLEASMDEGPCLTTPYYPKLSLFSNVHFEYDQSKITIFAGPTKNSLILGAPGRVVAGGQYGPVARTGDWWGSGFYHV